MSAAKKKTPNELHLAGVESNPLQGSKNMSSVTQNDGIDISRGVAISYTPPAWALHVEGSSTGSEANLTFSGVPINFSGDTPENNSELAAYAMQEAWLSTDGMRVEPPLLQMTINVETVQLGIEQATEFANGLLQIVQSITAKEAAK